MESLLDEVMPRYDVHEVHATVVAAPPAEAYAAVEAVRAREIRLLGPLMALRTGRRRLFGDPSAPVLEQFLALGFVVLGERPGSELVVGAVGRFWSPRGNTPLRISGRDEFLAFDEPSYAKAALNFLVRPEGSGSRIVTETRVVGTDPAATRKFRRYWLVIRLGSGAIRRSWLAAIRRRLQRESFSERT